MNQTAIPAIEETMRFLSGIGGHLFPCKNFELNNPNSKRPLLKGWQEPLPDILGSLSSHRRAIGWAIPPGVVVFDFDAPSPNRPQKRGIESFQKMLRDFDLDMATLPAAISGSGGIHLYFAADTSRLLQGQMPKDAYPDVDIKHHGGYVIVPPSPHWERGEYEWNLTATRMMDDGLGMQLPNIPPALLDAITRSSVTSDARGFGSVKLPLDMIAGLLSAIDPTTYQGLGGTEFFSLMASVKSAAAGDPEARDVFLRWCAMDPAYASDKEQQSVRYRWNSLREIKEITPRTLVFAAAKAVDERFSGPGQELTWKKYNSLIQTARASYAFDDVIFDTSLAPNVLDEAEPSSSGKIVLEWKGDAYEFLKLVDEQVMPTLVAKHHLFMLDGHLSQMVQISTDNWDARVVTKGSLLKTLSEVAELRVNRQLERGTQVDVEAVWSPALVEMVRDQSAWVSVPVVNEIMTQPFVDSTLKIHTSRGVVVEGTLTWCRPGMKVVAPDNPTRADAQDAFVRLMAMVGFDRFMNEEAKAVWLAGLLTVVCRRVIKGNVPCFLVTSDFGGAGKTAMALVPAIIARDDTSVLNVNFGSRGEEAEKRINAALRINCDSMVLDDIDYDRREGLESRLLNSVITAERPTIRVLGTSNIHVCPRSPVIWLTGLGIRVKTGSTLDRRLLPLILVTPDSQTADGVRGNFLDDVRKRRLEFLADAVTIVRAWMQAPEFRASGNQRTWASFESWDRVVRQGIQWIGMPDPLAVLTSEEGLSVLGRNPNPNVWADGRGDLGAAIDLVEGSITHLATTTITAEQIVKLARLLMRAAQTEQTAKIIQDFTAVTREMVNPFNVRSIQALLRQYIGLGFQGKAIRRVSLNPDVFQICPVEIL